MSQLRIARRYAAALMASAEDAKKLDRVTDDLKLLQTVARSSRDFVVFLKSPVIRAEKKVEAFDSMFKGKIDPLTLDFLRLLSEKGREANLTAIAVQYFQLLDEKMGVVSIDLKAATEFSAEQTAQLQSKFEGYTKKKVRFSISLDKELLGGFVARVSDTVFDGSIKRQLELIRESFVEGISRN